MPNKRKPRTLKILQRTLQKVRDRPEAEFPPASNLDAPDWLNGTDALAMWEKMVRLLMPQGLLTEADTELLAHACNAHGEIVKQTRAGLEVTSAQRAQLRYLFAEFGLSPASRSKAKPSGSGKPQNAFQALTGTE